MQASNFQSTGNVYWKQRMLVPRGVVPVVFDPEPKESRDKTKVYHTYSFELYYDKQDPKLQQFFQMVNAQPEYQQLQPHQVKTPLVDGDVRYQQLQASGRVKEYHQDMLGKFILKMSMNVYADRVPKIVSGPDPTKTYTLDDFAQARGWTIEPMVTLLTYKDGFSMKVEGLTVWDAPSSANTYMSIDGTEVAGHGFTKQAVSTPNYNVSQQPAANGLGGGQVQQGFQSPPVTPPQQTSVQQTFGTPQGQPQGQPQSFGQPPAPQGQPQGFGQPAAPQGLPQGLPNHAPQGQPPAGTPAAIPGATPAAIPGAVPQQQTQHQVGGMTGTITPLGGSNLGGQGPFGQ